MRSLLGAGGEVITHLGQEDLWSRRLYGLPLLAGWHSLVITAVPSCYGASSGAISADSKGSVKRQPLLVCRFTSLKVTVFTVQNAGPVFHWRLTLALDP